MPPPFFPDPRFGVAFLAALAVALVAASYSDLRFTVIPRWLSVAAAAAGVAFNAARGGWLAGAGYSVWVMAPTGSATGAIDGLLFSLAGFLLGFAVFFALWVSGICGGGDVKFFAALGAWIGPKLVLYVLAVTLVILGAVIIGTGFLAVITGNVKRLRPGQTAKVKRGRRLVTFALPLSLATAVVLAWVLRFELNLATAPPAVALLHGGAHAR